LTKEQLPELPYEQILCEPSRNNTAPSIAYTAFRLYAQNPESIFLVASSDHIILKEEEFLRKAELAYEYATQNNALVTIGITPTRPDTGYGYINYEQEGEICKVKEFCEKPNIETAKMMVASGEYLWNAGIFIWKSANVLESLRQFQPDLYQLFRMGMKSYNTPEEQDFINEYYPQSENISIDYALMEKATNVFTIPADIGWSDLGTWASLYSEMPKDDDGNVFYTENHLAFEAKNNLVKTKPGKLVVLKDIDNYMIIDEDDVLMIVPMNKEQAIKSIVSEVGKKFSARS
jgi:mannose-1-phosphate guanylyltransferase